MRDGALDSSPRLEIGFYSALSLNLLRAWRRWATFLFWLRDARNRYLFRSGCQATLGRFRSPGPLADRQHFLLIFLFLRLILSLVILVAGEGVEIMYVCNCNGIREAAVRELAPACARPVDMFKALGCRPKCGQCLDDVRRHIHNAGANSQMGPSGSVIRKNRT